MIETGYFATGCFWGAERRFWQTPGVTETAVGYMGGSKASPSYEDVCTGATGHAEIVRVRFDTALTSYRKLLELFWEMHDPTTLNRQGNDVGTQYRSAIYYVGDSQREAAESTSALYGAAIAADVIRSARRPNQPLRCMAPRLPLMVTGQLRHQLSLPRATSSGRPRSITNVI